ncbi:MAG: sigma-70 family RNA polymerase sigma factor [Lapillicoccus sp.]
MGTTGETTAGEVRRHPASVRGELDDIDDLVAAARDGDAAAMHDLLTRLEPLVMRRCAKFLPCRADAEEASQDALVAISSKLGTFSGSGSFIGWVTVIASNSARSTYRSLKRRFDEHPVEIVPERLDPRTTSVIAGSRLDLMDALEAMERERPALVEAFVLRDLGSLPYDEIAGHLGVPLGTVKARIHDARAYVRARLLAGLT